MTTQKVFVSCWQRMRRVAVSGSSLVFQVTLTCGHCGICSGRVSHVQSALERSGASWQWVSAPEGWPEGVRCVDIQRIAGVDPLVQLQRQLDLTLYREGRCGEPTPVRDNWFTALLAKLTN